MCTAQFVSSTPISSGTVITPFFGTSLTDGNLLPLGDPIVGLADGSTIQLNATFRLVGVIVDSHTFTGYSWDAVSGAWNLWQLAGGDPSGLLTNIFNAVYHTYVNAP